MIAQDIVDIASTGVDILFCIEGKNEPEYIKHYSKGQKIKERYAQAIVTDLYEDCGVVVVATIQNGEND